MCAGIIIGTVLATVFRWDFFSSFLWMIFVVLIFLFCFVKPNYLGVGIMVICGSILAFYRISGDLAGQDFLCQFVGSNMEISGLVSDDPDNEGGMSIKLKDIRVGDNTVKGAIYVKLASNRENIQRGDKITISGKMSEGFGSFSGAFYRPELVRIEKGNDIFLSARNWFNARVRKFVPEEESRLALAYLTGTKSGLSDEMMEILRVVGLTHIVVASGTHLGIITDFVKKIFGKLSRFAGVFFSLFFIILFGGVIGWTASITRAVIVTTLSLVTWYVGRKIEPWRIILLAMAATLMINPMFLTNLGWLLSFGSYAGIMLLSPAVKKWLYGKDEPSKIMELILTTISAQLLCIPIILYEFGTMSAISVLANILILPTIPITMGMTFLAGVCAWPVFGDIFGFITKIFIDYHTIIMKVLARQKMFVIEMETEQKWVFLLYIIIILPFLVSLVRRKIKEMRENRL